MKLLPLRFLPDVMELCVIFPPHMLIDGALKHIVSCKIESVMQDGTPAQYKIQMLENGKRILIGDPHKTLSFGVHVYDIVYTTNRQLGFFETHDELYWNVTGNGWRLPIDHALGYHYIA